CTSSSRCSSGRAPARTPTASTGARWSDSSRSAASASRTTSCAHRAHPRISPVRRSQNSRTADRGLVGRYRPFTLSSLQEIPYLLEQHFLARRGGRRRRLGFLLAAHPIDQLHEQEDRESHDGEVEQRLQKHAI